METHPRPIRTLIDACPFKAPPRSKAQQARYDRILGAAEIVMATFGSPTITLANLAIGLELSVTTLRRMIIDMDYLLYLILSRHLAALHAALLEIPETDADCHQRRRAAYLAATRAPDGSLTHAHTLLVRDATHLPADLLPEIEASQQALAKLLTGNDPYLARQIPLLLDEPGLTADQVETIIPRCEAYAATCAEQLLEWQQNPAGLPPPDPPHIQPPEAWMTDEELEQALGPPEDAMVI